MKWSTTTGCILAILFGCVNADCGEAFQCIRNFFTELSIDMRETNPITKAFQVLDGVCEDIDQLMECYGSFASCNMYTQYISLPTSVQVSKGLKMLCDFEYKISLECPVIGQFLTWVGNKVKNKLPIMGAKFSTSQHMEEMLDLVCQEKKAVTRYSAEIDRCEIVQPLLNITFPQGMIEITCDNKEVIIEATKCSQNIAKGFILTTLSETVTCVTTYFTSLQNLNNPSLESHCRLWSELMTCSSYMKAAMKCRRGIYELMDNRGHRLPCSEIFLSLR